MKGVYGTVRVWGPMLGILLLSIVSYLPSLRGEFILDDKPLIQNNPFLSQSHPISSYLAQEDGITDGSGYSHTGYYRPLINVTYRIDTLLWGPQSTGFRATNLLFHLVTCLLLYQTVLLLYPDRWPALLLTLLFALHPVNTETVSWVTSRNNMVVTLFTLASFCFYVIGWCRKRISLVALSAAAFAGAVLSKEFGLILPAMIFLYHRVIVRQRGHWILEAWTYLPFVLVAAVYFFLRQSVTGAILSPADSGDLWTRIYFAPYLLLFNLRLIFLPFGLHSFIVGYPQTFPHLTAWAGFGGLGLIGWALWKMKENRVFVFGVLVFLCALFPVLNVVNTSAVSLVSMRWLYFPMALLSIGLSPLAARLIARSRFVTLTCLVCVAGHFAVYTAILNRNLWHSEETFFTHEVRLFHNVFYAGGLAEIYYDQANFPEAERWFKVSLESNPNDVRDRINYAALLVDTGRPQEATRQLNDAKTLLMTHRDRAEWYNNWGMAKLALGDYEEALRSFKKAVIYDPDEPLFWSNLGGTHGSLGDYRNSVAAFQRGLHIAEDFLLLRKNLANTYIKMGAYGAAVSVLEKIPAHERQEDPAVLRLLTLASGKGKGRADSGVLSVPSGAMQASD